MSAETTTRCCTFRLEPKGYVRATISEGAEFTLDDAREAVAATWLVAGERRGPVLVDMRGVRAQSRESREYFMSDEVEHRISVIALLVGSPLSRMIANFFLRLGANRVPTRLFTEESEAEAWLLERDA